MSVYVCACLCTCVYGKCVCRVGAVFFNCSLQITFQSDAPKRHRNLATIYPVMSIARVVKTQVGKECTVLYKVLKPSM